MLQVYNTLSRTKEPFKPHEPNKVKMYVCGVTVYDYCHLGHARAYIVFDMIRRYLEYRKYAVTYIQNFTDIDDKIIRRANETKTSYLDVTEKFIAEYYQDFDALGIKRADMYPKATEHIGEIIAVIEALIAKGKAYAVQGDVYYDVSTFPEYGKLSGRKLDDNEAGARVAVDDIKKNPLDFALWKSAKPDEPSWDSPWGKGRPGWHIECSAMSMKHLGETFDIHGGGQDLVFPHHENEIAQSEGATGKPYVKYWLHNGFVNIDNAKMSKSLGNFFTIRDILKKYDPEVLRFFVLTTHYRSPINFSEEQLIEAKKGLEKLYVAIYENKEEKNDSLQNYADEFVKYMDDDFNSAGAIGVLFTLATHANREKSSAAAALLKQLGGVLGLLQAEKKTESLDAEIETLIEQRIQAKKNKDFATADKIRNDLLERGIALKDTPQGTTWSKI
jgi:cysteinyl-tRNA synthetase